MTKLIQKMRTTMRAKIPTTRNHPQQLRRPASQTIWIARAPNTVQPSWRPLLIWLLRPVLSPALVEDDPIWAHDSNMDHLPDSELSQQSPCQTNRTSAGDSTACTDASFDVSPTSPESQPCLHVSDEQQLVTEATGATSEPGIMADALSDEGSCHGAHSTPASPSMRTYSPIAASPEEMAHTLLHDSEVCASTSRDDAIPGAHTSSPAVRLSPESQQEQDFDHTSCGSSDAESESSEAESGS